jgi:hypothetical protein
VERYNRILDKAINMLSWNRGTDLYAQRYVDLFNPDHRNLLEGNYREKIAGDLQQLDLPPIGKLSPTV